MPLAGNTTGQQGQQAGGYGPLYGFAPSPGVIPQNTGIPVGGTPGIPGMQAIYAGMGVGPNAGMTKSDLPPSLAGSGNAGHQAANQAFNMLNQQQGIDRGNQFGITVNKAEADLGAKQAQAQSNALAGGRQVLLDQWGNYLGNLAQGNDAVVNNYIRNLQLKSNLLGDLFKGMLGSFGGVGGLTSGLLGGGSSGGDLGSLLSGISGFGGASTGLPS